MIELNIEPIPPVNIDDVPEDWELVDIDNISGRLNVMWLTPEGIGIKTLIYSHMAILNMVCEKSKKQDFWDIEEIKKHYVNISNTGRSSRYDVDDPVQLGKYKDDSLSPIAPFRILNIGNTKKVFLLDFIKEIEKVLGKKAKRNYMPLQKGDVKQTLSNTNLLKRITNYNPKINFKTGIRNFLDWYLKYYN